MGRKRSKWRWILLGVLAFFVIAIVVLALLLSFDGRNKGEDNRRWEIAQSIKKQAEDHYKQSKEYPALHQLSPPHREIFIQYVRSGVVEYYRDASNKKYFVIRFKLSGHGKTRDGKFSVGWNGMQYSNDRKQLIGYDSSWDEGQSTRFYPWDLH